MVVPASGTGAASHVVLSTALGSLYYYASGPAGVARGPLAVVAGEIGGVPPGELPSSTYSFLSATPSGTLLVTTTAGGVEWAKEKAWFAVVNGAVPPLGGGAGRAGLGAGAVAGIVLGTLLGVGVVGAGLYAKVPAFAGAVDAVGGGLKAGFSNLAAVASNDAGGGGGGFREMGAKSTAAPAFGGSGGSYGAVGQSAP